MTSPTRILHQWLLVVLFLTPAGNAFASTTWYVDGVNGNDNNNCLTAQAACKTIGHAISLASRGDSIKVAPATYPENLTISISLAIVGSSAPTTIIDGGQNGSVVSIPATKANVTLSGFTIRNGHGSPGGGISNFGILTVNSSTVTGNNAYCPSEPCHNHGSGGGIFNVGTLTVNNSTVSGNTAQDSGGGIDSYNSTTVNNSTITGNTSSFDGGGLANCAGPLNINNSTIVGNSTPALGGGIYHDDRFGGVTTIQNSIVANSASGGSCSGAMISSGYNLSSDNTCSFNGPGDLNNTQPMLGTLGNNGGPTQTIPELTGSPTIDAGNPNGCTNSSGQLLTIDQRGYPRPGKFKHDKRCDMGAYESQND